MPELTDVNSDQQQGGLETRLAIDRATAARLGVTARQIDNTLYDAFGERVVSTIYTPRNQYKVVMEVSPQYWQTPDTLNKIFVSTAGGIRGTQATNALADTVTAGTAVAGAGDHAGRCAGGPQSGDERDREQRTRRRLDRRGRQHGAGTDGAAIGHRPLRDRTRPARRQSPGAVRRDDDFVQPETGRLARARRPSAIDEAILRIGVPATIVGTFEGTARAFQSSLRTQPLLILAALLAVYIVLGVLYESLVHPITILSTLPSAGVGAVLALLLFDTEFSIIALIGVILLIGIVKKNAIMMIDFALAAERSQGLGVARGDLPGGAAALSSDHDDDGRGDARRRAAGDRVRRGFGVAPAARHRDRRRAAREPDADAVHDPGRLSVP